VCDWELAAQGREAAEEILATVYGIEVRKALDPLKLRDFEQIVRSLAMSLRGHAVPVEDAALKQALAKLDARWTDLGPAARKRVIDEAARYLGPPVVAGVLPKIQQTLSFAAKDIIPSAKKSAVHTFDLNISPNLGATDERIGNYVRVSSAHFIRNRYGDRMNQFADQARDIVAGGLERGSGSADIAEQLHNQLGTHAERGRSYWNVVAMVFANRARTMTQLAAYHEAGIEAYRWESVLDEATSTVCRFMHGRRFPVHAAMQRFQDVESADRPEAVKELQPFVSMGRDGERAALVYGQGDSRSVVAHVTDDASGRRDETGSYANAMADDALAAAGISTPPIHGNCRSTIVPEFGGGGGGRGGGIVPPPPPPPPERLTPGARKAKALEDLEAVPTVHGGADVSHLFDVNPDPPFVDHPLFADVAGGEAGAQWQANVESRRPKLDDLIATDATFNKSVVEKMIQKPKALKDAPAPKVVKYQGKLYVVDGHEALLAQKLLGQTTANVDYVNLDKPLKPAPLVAPAVTPPPAPKPAIIAPTPPQPPPPKKAAFEPAPPPPRPQLKTAPPVVDLAAQRAKAEKLAQKDAALFEGKTDDELAPLELAARRTLKQPKGRGKKEMVSSPIANGRMPGNAYAEDILSRMGIEGRLDNVLAKAPRERVLVEDYVAQNGELYRRSVEREIADLVRNRGAYSPRDDEHDGPPVVIRIGDKLYPVRGIGDTQMSAAKALGLKTVEAHVIDATPVLARKAEEDNAEMFRMMKPREEKHAEEVLRVQREVEARMAREQVGNPAVVAVREKHQPAAFAAKHREVYQEAAASVGWGEAMRERGLDFPLDHLARVARRFDVEGHPLREAAQIAQESARVGGGASLREQIANRRHRFDTNKLEALAAIVGHVDAIQPTSIAVEHYDAKIGPRAQVDRQLGWLADLVDRSVATPSVHMKVEPNDRASCSTSDIQGWNSRTARLLLAKNEDTATVWHEMGHAIEGGDRSRGIRASAFLDARTVGEEKRKLSELTGIRRYRDDELARPDAFLDAYMGKDYGRESAEPGWWGSYFGDKAPHKGVSESRQTHRSTEVTSMAIESLGYESTARRGWAEQYRKDREHFFFGLGQLGGY
jgi:SPP1 gp7 family putative phage head morphogenesis protein